MSRVTITEPGSKLHCYELDCQHVISQGSKESQAAQRGANRRREKGTKRPTNGEKKRESTRQTHTNTKRSDKEEKEAGAHRADGEANARTDTPQREGPTHAPSTISKRAPNKTGKEREDREERKGYKVTPSGSTAARNTKDRGSAYLTALNKQTTQIQVRPTKDSCKQTDE